MYDSIDENTAIMSLTPATRLSTFSPFTSGLPVRVEDYVTDEAAQRFAVAFVKDPTDAWAAAHAAWPDDPRWKSWAYQNLPGHPQILAFVAAVHELVDRESLELPSEHEYAVFLWKAAQSALDDKIKLSYLRLLAEARGHLKRPQGSDTNITVNQNRVMIVESQGNDDQWEVIAQQQQDNLQDKLSGIAIEEVDAAD